MALGSESLLIAKESHWCTENYSSILSTTASSLRTNNKQKNQKISLEVTASPALVDGRKGNTVKR